MPQDKVLKELRERYEKRAREYESDIIIDPGISIVRESIDRIRKEREKRLEAAEEVFGGRFPQTLDIERFGTPVEKSYLDPRVEEYLQKNFPKLEQPPQVQEPIDVLDFLSTVTTDRRIELGVNLIRGLRGAAEGTRENLKNLYELNIKPTISEQVEKAFTDPKDFVRDRVKAFSEGLSMTLRMLPPVLAYEIAMPQFLKTGGDIGEGVGIGREKGEFITERIAPFVFGKPVGIMSNVAWGVSEISDPVLESIGLWGEDKELGKQMLHDLTFFGGLGVFAKSRARKPIEVKQEPIETKIEPERLRPPGRDIEPAIERPKPPEREIRPPTIEELIDTPETIIKKAKDITDVIKEKPEPIKEVRIEPEKIVTDVELKDYTKLEEGEYRSPTGEIVKAEEVKSLSDIRKEKYLETKIEGLNKLINEGWKPIAKDVKDNTLIIKVEKEIDYLKREAPIGNKQHPDTKRLSELQQQLKEGITKKSYRLEKEGTVREITKTEYDYLQKPKAEALKQPSIKKIIETPQEQQLQDVRRGGTTPEAVKRAKETIEGKQEEDGIIFGSDPLGVTHALQNTLRSQKFADISGTASKYWNQLQIPPTYFALKNENFYKVYRVMEDWYEREFNYDYYRILESPELLNKFKDFRALEKSDKDGLLSKMDEYFNTVYRTGEHINPDNLIKRYELNEAQSKVFMQWQNAAQAALENKKQGEVIFIKDFIKDPLKPNKDGIPLFTIQELKTKFPDLVEKYDLENITEVGLKNLWNALPNLKERVARDFVEEKYAGYKDRVYINLSRPLEPNEYAVYSQKGKEVEFTHFKTREEVDAYKKEKEADGWTILTDQRIKDTINNPNFYNKISEWDLLRLIESTNVSIADATVQKLYERIISKGWDKHTIETKYIPGYKFTPETFEKGIEHYIEEASTAKNRRLAILYGDQAYSEYSNKVQEILKDPKTSLRDKAQIKADLEYATKFIAGIRSSDKTILDGLRKLTSIQRLGLKPPWLVQQGFQPVQTTLPWLMSVAREGDIKISDAKVSKIFAESFVDATKYSMERAGLKIGEIDKELHGIMDELRYMRKISTIGQDIFYNINPSDYYGSMPKKVVDGVVAAWTSAGRGLEYITRAHSAVAFIKLGKLKGLKDKELVSFVADNIDRTMFEYSKIGRLVIMNPKEIERANSSKLRRAIAKSYLVYKTFSSHNIGQWGELIRRRQAAPLITKMIITTGVRGIKGMPYAASLIWLADLIDPDEREWDSKMQDASDYIDQKYNTKIGGALMKGMGTYLGVDLSFVFAETAPLPTEGMNFTKVYGKGWEKSIARAIEMVTGAPYGTAKDVYNAAYVLADFMIKALGQQHITQKEKDLLSKQILNASPDAISNVFKSADWADEGIKWGNKLIVPSSELSKVDLVLKKLSFTSEKVSEAYRRQSDIEAKETERKEKQQEVKDKITLLYDSGDIEATNKYAKESLKNNLISREEVKRLKTILELPKKARDFMRMPIADRFRLIDRMTPKERQEHFGTAKNYRRVITEGIIQLYERGETEKAREEEVKFTRRGILTTRERVRISKFKRGLSR